MKNTIKSIALILLVTFVSFSFSTLHEEKKDIKIADSKVVWKGYKVGGSHEGNIAIKSGFLTFDEAALVGGSFVMDMTTISSTDLTGGSKKKLEGHLKSDDFFGVEKFPTATLNFTSAKATGKNSYQVTGNITIKGKTETVSLIVSVYGSKANVSLKIDRTKFDVRYGSTSFFDGLKNKAIYDEFDIIADLEF